MAVLFILWSGRVSATDDCRLTGPTETVAWDYLVDGDTLILKDGRKVRFASINTPETSHDNKPAEPYGEAAHRALKKMLRLQPQLYFQQPERRFDHHGRNLGSFFLLDGRSVDALLLSRGLAYQLFSEQSDSYRSCLQNVEKSARQKQLGVWSAKTVRDIRSDRLQSGFQLVRGAVVSLSKPAKSDFAWLEMDGPVVIRIPKAGLDERWLKSLRGQTVELRGWLVDRRAKKNTGKKFKRWMMGIYHPDAVQIFEKEH
ncbi:MAG: thermonuclease family protein [Endozoicomonas sp.]